MNSWLRPANLAWLLFYLATMSAVVWGMFGARRWATDNLASPVAREQWEEFRSDMKKLSQDPRAPIQRGVPKSSEPQMLPLLRDYFGVCLCLALLLSSLLFGTLMIMVRGVFSGETNTAQLAQEPPGKAQKKR